MSHEELMGWISYFEMRPLGWREDLRTAHLLASAGDKRSPSQMFSSLEALSKRQEEEIEEGKPTGLKGSMFFHKMLSAKSGEKLKFLEKKSDN